MQRDEQERWMRRAIDLARKGWGKTHPNPMVGAVIVEDGRIVSEGFHEAAGGPHAEVAALRDLGGPPGDGATLVVTLEPCSTKGRTGACADALIEAGVRRVIVGARDPNPAHMGAGIDRLREAGVEVIEGVLNDECRDLNIVFNHWITRGEPLLAAKVATTIDGRVACRTGESKWITGEAARADVMLWRRLFPGIAVGANTVLLDSPRLTSRLPEGEWCPIRFVFDGLLRTAHRKELPSIYADEFRGRTVVVTTEHAGSGYARRLRAEGIRVWCFPSPSANVPFDLFRRECAKEEIVGVYFEGGANLLSEMLQRRQIDYLFAYRAPLLLGDEKARSVMHGLRTERLDQAVRLEDVRHATFGDDQLARGRTIYPEKMSIDEVVHRHY